MARLRNTAALVLASLVWGSLGCAEGVTRTYDARTAGAIAHTTRVRLVDGASAYEDPRAVRVEFPEGSVVPNEGVVRRHASEPMVTAGILLFLAGGALAASAAACQPDSGSSIGPGGQGLCRGLLAEAGVSIALTGIIVFFAGLAKHAYVEASPTRARARPSFSPLGLGVSF